MADPPPATSEGAVPTPAATVVPLRDGEDGLEVLLLRRNTRGQFGGMWVFPGGQVDPADLVDVAGAVLPDAFLPGAVSTDAGPTDAGPTDAGPTDAGPTDAGPTDSGAEVRAARRAAVREAREEAGLELEEQDLVTLSFWLPPTSTPRRFATWFFLAPAAVHQRVIVDDYEIHEHRWQKPVEAMAARDAGEIALAPPTFTTLWWLSQQVDVAGALASAETRPPERFLSRLALGPDQQVMATLWDGDAGYLDGDLDRPGPRRRLWVGGTSWRVDISN